MDLSPTFCCGLGPSLCQDLARVEAFEKSSTKNDYALTAAVYMLPPILVQFSIFVCLILCRSANFNHEVDVEGGVITQRIVCDTETPALFIATLLFECLLVIVGCVLAWQTRNLDEKFGEAKRLAFPMYNVALIGGLLLFVIGVTDVTPNAEEYP